MKKPRRTTLLESKIAQTNLTVKYKKYTSILKPGLESRSSIRRSIAKEDIEIDEKYDVIRLIEQQKRRLVKNIFYISGINVATYLVRDVIGTNWTDSTLVVIRYILSSFLLTLITPLFVPRMLRTYTITSSLRMSVIAMILIVSTMYRPFPYVIIFQTLMCAFPESVLRVTTRLYMVRIAKIWSRITGVDVKKTILRVFALYNFVNRMRYFVYATIKYTRIDPRRQKNLFIDGKNVTCAIDYCERTRNLIVNYVYDVKYKNFDKTLIVPMSMAIVAITVAIGIAVLLDRLDVLSKSEFGDEPKTCRTIDVFLQLCRPRMSYLVGIVFYYPFMTTMGQSYIEAYGTCALPGKHHYIVVIVTCMIEIHAVLSAEILVDILGTVGCIQLALATTIATFAILCLYDHAETIGIDSIFIVFYVIHHWTSMYGLYVGLLTERLIGDREIAAWTIHATIFYAGMTLSNTFRYVCIITKLRIMIVLGVIVLSITHFLRIEMRKTFTTKKSANVREYRRNDKWWIMDSNVNLDKWVDMDRRILWIQTFWRRTVVVVSRPCDCLLSSDNGVTKKRGKCGNLIERRDAHDLNIGR